MDQNIRKLIKWCVEVQPEDRPTAEEVLETLGEILDELPAPEKDERRVAAQEEKAAKKEELKAEREIEKELEEKRAEMGKELEEKFSHERKKGSSSSSQ